MLRAFSVDILFSLCIKHLTVSVSLSLLSELWNDEVTGRKKRQDALSPDKKRRRPSVVSDILPLLILLLLFTLMPPSTSTFTNLQIPVTAIYMFCSDFLPASCGTVLNSTHARILFICCLTWTSLRTGQLLERCVNVSVDKGVSLSPGGITVCMQTSLSNHILVCRPTGRGDTGSPPREIWFWQLRVPIQTRQEQTYSQLLRNTHTHTHTHTHTLTQSNKWESQTHPYYIYIWHTQQHSLLHAWKQTFLWLFQQSTTFLS